MSQQYRVVAPLVIAPDADGKLHYHYAGVEVESIDADAAKRLLAEGLIEKVRASGRSTPATSSGKGQNAKGGDQKSAGGPGSDSPPPLVAPDEDWIAYAIAQGVPEDEAKATSKADLIARFAQ